MDIGQFIDENNHGQFIELNDTVFNHPEMDVDETVVVKKEQPKFVWNWKKDIAQLLMSGYHSDFVMHKFGQVIADHPQKDKILKYIAVNDGLLGYLFIDTSFFDDKFDYSNVPNKLKQYNLYAIHSPAVIYCETSVFESTGDGTIDGMLNCDDKVVSNQIAVDGFTNLPILKKMSDVQGLDTVLKFMLDNGVISVAQFNSMSASDNPLLTLKNFWKNEFVSQFGKTNTVVDNDISVFDVKEQELAADVAKANSSAEVYSVEQKLDDIGDVKTNKDLDVESGDNAPKDGIDAAFDNIEVGRKQVQDIDDEEFHLSDDDGSEIELDDNSNEMVIDIADGQAVSDGTEVFFDDIDVTPQSQEIDEDEFFGLDNTDDEIQFDKKQKKIDVSNNYSFDW